MKFINIAAFLASAALVSAQNATYACLKESQLDAKIPDCAKSCQQMAIHQDGCTDYEDVACHCLATNAIGDLLGPCLANSTCTTDELTGKVQPRRDLEPSSNHFS
jgi:hypothetical protein